VGDWRGLSPKVLKGGSPTPAGTRFRRRLTEPAVTKPLIIRTVKEIASARSIFSYELDCIVVPIEQDDPGSVFHLTLLCGVSRPQMSVVNVRSPVSLRAGECPELAHLVLSQSVGRIQ
jgi:hypothetical protein